MTKKKNPSPNRNTIYSKWIIAINKLRAIKPQIIPKPSHQIGRRFTKLRQITLPNTKMFPMPIKCYPPNGIQYPKNRKIKRIPSRNITSATASRTITRKTIAKIFWLAIKIFCLAIFGKLIGEERKKLKP